MKRTAHWTCFYSSSVADQLRHAERDPVDTKLARHNLSLTGHLQQGEDHGPGGNSGIINTLLRTATLAVDPKATASLLREGKTSAG